MLIKNFPWILKAPEESKIEYAAARTAGNAERLRATALILLIIYSCFLIQHLLSPGIPRTGIAFAMYLTIYILFIFGSTAYLLFERICSPVTKSSPAQWMLIILILSGSIGLALTDSSISGDLSSLFLGLIAVAVLYRCPSGWFAFSVMLTVSAYILGAYSISGRFLTIGLYSQLVIVGICTIFFSMAFGHYDIRTFCLQKELKAALAEKEIILTEVHHRIKNNMHIISGLLLLHSYSLKEPSAIAALEDAIRRVKSMMILYEKLYQSADFKEISVSNYFSSLVDEIIANFPDKDRIKIQKVFNDDVINSEIIFPLGIIINEILTNAMKYAFKGRDSGLIKIAISFADNDGILVIEDDGIGMPDSVSFENTTGFGLSLISMMTKQLRGQIHIENTNGTKIVLNFQK